MVVNLALAVAAMDVPPEVPLRHGFGRVYFAETTIATVFVEQKRECIEAAGGAGSIVLFGDTVFAVDVKGDLITALTTKMRSHLLFE